MDELINKFPREPLLSDEIIFYLTKTELLLSTIGAIGVRLRLHFWISG
jgi:hypothetical protein